DIRHGLRCLWPRHLLSRGELRDLEPAGRLRLHPEQGRADRAGDPRSRGAGALFRLRRRCLSDLRLCPLCGNLRARRHAVHRGDGVCVAHIPRRAVVAFGGGVVRDRRPPEPRRRLPWRGAGRRDAGCALRVRRVPGNLDVGDGRAIRAGRAVFAEGTRRSRAGRVALDRGAPSAFARGDAARRRGQGGQRMTTHLDLRDISVSFNGFKALNGLNMSVRKGELRCLIGPNGAGKTTALDIICGKVKPSVGTVTFDGTALHDLEEHEIARVGVGRKFQVPSVFRDLTVAENLEVARARRPAVWANLRWDVRRAGRADIERLAELIGLTEQLERPAAYLSHGQTQWLEIGMLVAQDAELILMDEPTAGMTAQETRKTAELLDRLKGKHTLVVVEHDMGFVKAIGDIISVMHMGQLLAEGTGAEVEAHPEVRRAYLGSGGITNA